MNFLPADAKVALSVRMSVAIGSVENAVLIVNCSARLCPEETVAVIVDEAASLEYVPLVLLKWVFSA